MTDKKCPHAHTDMGFGLAGGGYGPYLYCEDCGAILDKWQERDESASADDESE